MVNGASMYSLSCRYVKYNPSPLVQTRAVVASVLFPEVNLWCAQVTVTPEARRTAVFRSGTENGFSGWIPGGGHVHEIWGVGASLLWKNLQKNAKKNITSETMNRIIPNFRPLRTSEEWWP